jgi:hypothetical protein
MLEELNQQVLGAFVPPPANPPPVEMKGGALHEESVVHPRNHPGDPRHGGNRLDNICGLSSLKLNGP